MGASRGPDLGRDMGRTCSSAAVISKTPTTKVAGIYKKIMKSEYQLVFEFINKVLCSSH